MSQPLVDILLATYNGGRFLAPQLDSLLAQTHDHFRLLVSDDGSRDDTLDVLRRYQPLLGERLRVLPYTAAGQGAVRNFEHLMQASLADGQAGWMAFCDQDDVWLPHKIERLLAAGQALQARVGEQAPCLVHCDLAVVDAELATIHPSFTAFQRTDPAACTPLTLLSINQVTGCATLVNRAMLQLALPVPPEAIMHDWWLAVLTGGGHCAYVPEALVRYRQHGANQLGARDRALPSRLRRLAREGDSVWQRVQALGQATRAQALALQQRLSERGLDAGYVRNYLRWRDQALPLRLLGYRRHYVGPELDRLSRCLLWR